MTLIQKWENFEHAKIISEIQQILMHHANWDDLFSKNSNGEKFGVVFITAVMKALKHMAKNQVYAFRRNLRKNVSSRY